jgi:pseudaminic acid cytidylyltransferase
MNVVALIPARAGSKRIPGKNIRNFDGKPALCWVFDAIRAAGTFDRILVSTDGDEIGNVAAREGVEVLVRDPALADDHTGLLDVVQSEIGGLGNSVVMSTVVACVLPTAVLISAADLEEAVNSVKSGQHQFVVSVGRFSYPVQRALRLDVNSALEMVWPDNYSKRSQDLEPLFHDAGQMYVGTVQAWMARPTIFSAPVSGLLVDDWRVQDIDIESDWIHAERIWRAMKDL